MTETMQTIEEVADALIIWDKPLTSIVSSLFGHRRPLGSRWSITAGSENLVPFKTLVRRIPLNERYESGESLLQKFKLLYPDSGEVPDDMFVYYPDVNRYTIRGTTGSPSKFDGVLTIDHYINPEEEPCPSVTSADIGRMMLVDQLLYRQGFRGGRTMDQDSANLALTIIQLSNR